MNSADIFDRSIPEPNSGCWLWEGATHRQGYGSVKIGQKSMLAHRVAYAEAVGEIPDGLDILHKCDNPACINPLHLYAGTHTRNMRDRRDRDHHNWRKLSQAQVKAILSDDRKAEEIAADYGVTSGAVTYQKRAAFGISKPFNKLTNEQIAEIVSDKRNPYEIAQSYGVTPATIYYHRRKHSH